jgi:hypothetical protein
MSKIKNIYAPVVLFAYNRKQHLEICIEALKQNNESKYTSLIIYCDGAKGNDDLLAVEEVRNYIKKITGFKDIELNFSEFNKGLAASIIDGISHQFNKHEKLIVLEDDIIPSKFFLSYMNTSLTMYEFNSNVASIHGYTYPIKYLPTQFFIRGADCWGWATWKRSWDDFEPNGTVLLEKLKSNNLQIKFNLFGSYNYTKMLQNQILGKNDSWAIRWHASNFIKNKLTLYPGVSLVQNIGTDGSGTNFKKTDKTFNTKFIDYSIKCIKIDIKENIYARNLFVLFFFKRKIKQIIKKLFYNE